MKNFFRFLMMALLAATTMVNVACSDDDDAAPTNSLIGTWVEDVEVAPYTLTFHANDTGVLTFSSSNTQITQTFEYTYDADDRRVDIIGSALGGTNYVIITANTMILMPYSSDEQYKFIRQ